MEHYAFQCLCKPLLGLSPDITLLGQTGLHRFKRPLAGLPVSLGTADCLIPGQMFMGQLGLEVTDRCLRFSMAQELCPIPLENGMRPDRM